ncbi:HEPN domain-containing protein [Methylobacterium marchantiae]|uniref:HEPN domain-containing protein n=1 Tax=Methylobacterium marchantiae TaxID=600331 RepID=A0ABW3X1J8_9HYPH|nr:hypothetical protein AIGOOFII_1011 [Methylobacterium marchantiae]
MTPTTYMEKALRALAGARVLLDADDSEGACSRAYYAMFDAARAALIAVEAEGAQESTKTHRGLIAAFGKHLVLTGCVDAELGRCFNKVQGLRMMADYVGEPLSREDAAWAIVQAEIFIQTLQERIVAP